MDDSVFVTPPTSPSAFLVNHVFPEESIPQQTKSSGPTKSPTSAIRSTPPVMPAAANPTTALSTTAVTASGPASTSKKNPTPVQTFPIGSSSSFGSSSLSSLEDSLEESLKIASTSSPQAKPVAKNIHPFAHSTAKLELIPSTTHTTVHGIDLDEEERLYAQLTEDLEDDGVYEDHTEQFTRTNTPVGKARTGTNPSRQPAQGRSRSLSTPSKLVKPRHDHGHGAPPLPTSHLRNQTLPLSRSPPSSSPHHPHLDLALPYKPYVSPNQSGKPRPPLAESIFSADIFLEDNTTSAAGSGLGRGTAPPLFAQDVRIDGWVVVGDGANPKGQTHANASASSPISPTSPASSSASASHANNILGKSQIGSLRKVSMGSGAYVVYDIVIVTREGTTMRVLRRYSAFEELYDALLSSVEPSLQSKIPSLPPKAPLARFRPAFLEKRRKLLEFWLTRVLLYPELGGREVVREWVLR